MPVEGMTPSAPVRPGKALADVCRAGTCAGAGSLALPET